MPVFTDEEIHDHDKRPTLSEALSRLPVLLTVDGLRIRDLDPLVDVGHDAWLEELEQGAWLAREEWGWDELLDDGDLLDGEGRIRPVWAEGFGRAVRSLASYCESAGPESDPHLWASWVFHTRAVPHRYLRLLAKEAGA
jgi:hypothetical protein